MTSTKQGTPRWKVTATKSNWPGRGYSTEVSTLTDAPVIVHGDTEAESMNRAHFIVQAVNHVNAHSQLLEACRAALAFYEWHTRPAAKPKPTADHFEGLRLMRAAIKAAEGGSDG